MCDYIESLRRRNSYEVSNHNEPTFWNRSEYYCLRAFRKTGVPVYDKAYIEERSTIMNMNLRQKQSANWQKSLYHPRTLCFRYS